MILETMGGLGLFLLGMMLLTDGLKQLAGQAMKKLLARFVRGPFSGLTTGALFTALIQSSSATTLTTIGFVSAGLITFQQAVGVVFGANIGTTSTGWIVSLLGLKISLGAVSPPLILLGVLLRLFSRDRFAALGGALAGFALIFFGIGVMQTGMEDLAARIDPASIPGDGLTGRFLLVLIGVVMTVVMQSSSAAVAATLIAVDSGAIGFEQAAALVVGQNIGTTVTAAIASIGASTPAKRTALAHIAFNLGTGVIAIAMLPVFAWFASSIMAGTDNPGAGSIAAFHTIFNVAGVLIFLPIIRPFARLIERLLPERGSPLTNNLDKSVAQLGSVALDAAHTATGTTLNAAVNILLRQWGHPGRRSGQTATIKQIHEAVADIRLFLARLAKQSQPDQDVTAAARLQHAIDHLDQLAETCDDPVNLDTSVQRLLGDAFVNHVTRTLADASKWLGEHETSAAAAGLAKANNALAEMRRAGRTRLLHDIAEGNVQISEGEHAVELIRWADSVIYHIARCVHYLQPEPQSAPPRQ